MISDRQAMANEKGRCIFWPAAGFAVALFVVLLVTYLLTLSRRNSPDGMSFALLTTRSDASNPLFFQAEHLLYPAWGWAWYRLWQGFGYGDGALRPMQVLSAIAGASGVASFYIGLYWVLGATMIYPQLNHLPKGVRTLPSLGEGGGIHGVVPLSLCGALLLGVSYGYWFHSTESEDQIIANALLAGAFAILAVIMTRTEPRGHSMSLELTLGGLSSLAILSHATAVLFLPALVVGLLLARVPRRSWIAIAVTIGGIVSVSYAFVGLVVHGFRSPEDFEQWLSSAPRLGVWGQGGLRSLLQASETLAGSVVYSGSGPDFKRLLSGSLETQNVLAATAFFVTLLAVGGSVVYVLVRWRRLPSRRFVAVGLVWTALYAVFGTYWAPEDLQFWIGLWPALILLISLALANGIMHRPRVRHFAGGFLFATVAAIALYNLGTAIVPRSDLAHNDDYAKAICLKDHTFANDLVISPGWDWTSTYVPYFAHREVLSIVDDYLLAAGKDAGRLKQDLAGQIAKTRASGGRVFVVRLYDLDENDRAWLARTTGLQPEDFPYPRNEAWRCAGETVWEIRP